MTLALLKCKYEKKPLTQDAENADAVVSLLFCVCI